MAFESSNQPKSKNRSVKPRYNIDNSKSAQLVLAIFVVVIAGLTLTISLAYTGYINLSENNVVTNFIRKVIFNQASYGDRGNDDSGENPDKHITKPVPVLDKDLYDRKIYGLAHRDLVKELAALASSTATSTIATTSNSNASPNRTVTAADLPPSLWPVIAPYPKAGAVLPFKRIIAYYGNLYSTKMGALGEYPEDVMLARLSAEVDSWTTADPETPAIPALHYIVTTAQQSPGDDGMYRARMPYTEIDKILEMANKIGALVFLDIQLGLSTFADELPIYSKYLELPNVHLGIDPEFAMLKSGKRPGTVVGTVDASDINFVTEYLANIVKNNDLPPKILVVHRYTRPMVTNYKQITIRPEVQIVMHMDGWGDRSRKLASYQEYIYKEPVEFTGFKLFYKNDVRPPGGRFVYDTSTTTTIMAPAEVLKLKPKPVYIQYQ